MGTIYGIWFLVPKSWMKKHMTGMKQSSIALEPHVNAVLKSLAKSWN